MLTVRYERLDLQPNDMVLDLGCGFGRHAYEALRRGADVDACDLGYEELVQVRNIAAVMWSDGEITEGTMLETANGDATQLPFSDESFDRVIASEVMEHIEQDQEVLSELTRVLRCRKNYVGLYQRTTMPRTLRVDMFAFMDVKNLKKKCN